MKNKWEKDMQGSGLSAELAVFWQGVLCGGEPLGQEADCRRDWHGWGLFLLGEQGLSQGGAGKGVGGAAGQADGR